LDILVQKLIGIMEGTDLIPLIIERDQEQGNEPEQLSRVPSDEYFMMILLKNTHLSTQHIDRMMHMLEHIESNRKNNDTFHQVLCKHPQTPTWILELAYKNRSDVVKTLVTDHPNTDPALKKDIQED
jgi:hypothetical protein